MAKQPTPLIEVVIRDEVTAGLERARKKIEKESADWVKGGNEWGGRVGEGVQLVRREFATLLGITGIGAFIGGGVVAGIVKITEALGGLAKESLQTRYSAEAMGITVEAMNRLTVRGMAVGQSQSQAQQSIKGLTDGIQNMIVQGTKSSEWQRLLKGKGGQQFGRELIAAYKGGGAEEAARYMATKMDGMALSGQRALTQMFSLGLGFKNLFKVDQKDLSKIVELSEPEARKFALAMANLNIESQNVAKTLALTVMPVFERMATAFAEFLAGPGAGVVKDFGAWLKALDINWDKVTGGIVSMLNALGNFFSGVSAFIQDVDPLIQEMGGWTPIIIGLGVALGVGGVGLAPWLTAVAIGLTAIGAAAFVIPALSSAAAASKKEETAAPTVPPEKQGASPPSTGGTGPAPTTRRLPPPGGPATFDERFNFPATFDERFGFPGRQSSRDDPENAAPYRVASTGWMPPPSSGSRAKSNTDELTAVAHELKTQVAALNKIANNMPLSDSSGAGSIAGFTGVLRRLGAPMGRGTGSGRDPGGGGYRGSGRRRGRPGSSGSPNQDQPVSISSNASTQDIINERAAVMAQMRDPAVRNAVASVIGKEMTWATARGDILETLVNRAVALIAQGHDPKGIVMRLLRNGFYGPINERGGKIPRASDQELADFDQVADEVGRGRNEVGGRNDQGTNRRGEPEVGPDGRIRKRGEYYGFHTRDTRTAAARTERNIAAARAGREQQTQQQIPPARQDQTGGVPGAGQVTQHPERTGLVPEWLREAMEYAGHVAGVSTDVVHGMERGHARHRPGAPSGDVDFYDPLTGRKLDVRRPEDQARMAAYVTAVVAAGAGGLGFGEGGRYMGFSRMHVGGGVDAIWGGTSKNPGPVPQWFRDAYNRGMAARMSPEQRAAAVQRLREQAAAGRKPSAVVWSNEAEIEALKEKRNLEITQRARDRINLRIRVRGPRGVRTTADSSGNISSPVIERSMDPTGGGQIQSPA